MVRGAPRGAWAAAVLIWLRTLALIGVVAALGFGLDAASGDGDITPRNAVPHALVAAALAIVAAAISMAAEAIPGRIQAREEATWRARVMAAVNTQLGDAPHGGKPLTEGAVVDAATAAVEKTAAYRATFLAPTFATFAAPILVVIAWAVLVHPLTALVLAGFVALVPVCLGVAGKLLRRSNAEYRRKEASATERYLEMIEGLGTLAVLEAAADERDRFAQSARASMHELGQLLIQNQRMIVVNDAVFGVLLGAAAVALSCGQLAAGQITLGQAIIGVLLTVLLQEPIDRTGRTFYVGLAGRARRDQLNGLIGRAASGRQDGDAQVAPPQSVARAPRISLHNVTIELGGERVLQQVSVVIPDGKRTVIVGPSGSGKTTLLRAIAGLTDADGRIRYDGERAENALRRASTTRMAQDAAIVSGTVRDNLQLARPDASDTELRDALRRAHFALAEGMDADHPGTLDAAVGDRGTRLSGGGRRRLMFARALLRDRPVLLLDEVTADLDRRTEAHLRSQVREYGAGKTVVEIVHRIDTTLDADRILVLEGGRITAAGTPQQLQEQPGYYREALAAVQHRHEAGTQ